MKTSSLILVLAVIMACAALVALVLLAVALVDLNRAPTVVSAVISPTVPPPTAAPPTPSATPTPLPPTASTTATATRLPATPTPRPNTPTPRPPDAVVLTDKLNLRDGPGTSYRIIGALSQGDPLTITGRSPDKSWLQVRTKAAQQGWCSGDPQLVSVNINWDQVAVVQNVPTARLTATSVSPTRPPAQASYVLYFYFAPEGCAYSRQMAPTVERYHQTNRQVEVKGVPVRSGDVDAFVRQTGISFPIVRDPGLPVDKSKVPFTVMVNKQTGTHRVTTIGTTPYETLVSENRAFMDGRTGSSGGTTIWV